MTDSFGDHLTDRVDQIYGSWWYVLGVAIFVCIWVTANTLLVVAGNFDPFPFMFLNLLLMVVNAFQGPLIMMAQNRSVQRDRDAIMGLHAKLDEIIQDEVQLIGLVRK